MFMPPCANRSRVDIVYARNFVLTEKPSLAHLRVVPKAEGCTVLNCSVLDRVHRRLRRPAEVQPANHWQPAPSNKTLRNQFRRLGGCADLQFSVNVVDQIGSLTPA